MPKGNGKGPEPRSPRPSVRNGGQKKGGC